MGLHSHMIKQKIAYVPQFLILDQLSQPYFERGKIDSNTGNIQGDDDKATLQDAFALLDKFMNHIIADLGSEFQIILLEHASQSYWTNPPLEYFHLVEEFRDGNAIVPKRGIRQV